MTAGSSRSGSSPLRRHSSGSTSGSGQPSPKTMHGSPAKDLTLTHLAKVPWDQFPCVQWNFSLVIVKRPSDGRVLAVRERPDAGWWLVGGRVGKGETFHRAAVRTVKESVGLDVELQGVMRVEFSPAKDATARMRVIFGAHVVDENQSAVSTDSDVMLQWCSIDELPGLGIHRGKELFQWSQYWAGGGALLPVDAVTSEVNDIPMPPSPTSFPENSDSRPLSPEEVEDKPPRPKPLKQTISRFCINDSSDDGSTASPKNSSEMHLASA